MKNKISHKTSILTSKPAYKLLKEVKETIKRNHDIDL